MGRRVQSDDAKWRKAIAQVRMVLALLKDNHLIFFDGILDVFVALCCHVDIDHPSPERVSCEQAAEPRARLADGCGSP